MSKTRKSKTELEKIINADPILAKMAEGKLLWGDIMGSPKKGSPTRKSPKKASPKSESPSQEKNALEDWNIPDLRQRKGIWENFPVILDRIRSHGGKDRYALLWHRTNLREWRVERSATYDEYMEYEAYAEYRLFHALRAHNHLYNVLPPENDKQIAILEMISESPKHNSRLPVLRRLNDIKEHFPVVWHPVEGRAGKSTYALELHGKKVRDISAEAGRNMTADIKRDLLAALGASAAWKLLPSVGGEVCRLEIL